VLDPKHPDRKTFVGSGLTEELRGNLIKFLSNNMDCFAWSHADMVGISPDVITHKLNVDPAMPPVKQRRKKFAPKRNQIIDEEIQKLLDNGMVREVQYPDWLANVVVVRKKNGK
jgi:hypothetical protein